MATSEAAHSHDGHGHDHGGARGRRRWRVHAAGERKAPIPQIKGASDAYRRSLTQRIDALWAVLRESIVDNDAARLQTQRANAVDDLTPAGSFGFGTNADKRDAFDTWLGQSLDEGVLEVTSRDAVRGGRHFTAPHTRTAYSKGVDWADARLREADVPIDSGVSVDLRRGVHGEQLEQLYTRNYRGLEKITREMDADISRTFSEALGEGVNPREAGRRLSDDVNTYRNRAETLARTEFQHSHNAASARRYGQMGVEKVEILTADPCDICASLAADGPYPVNQAASLIPASTHPNCICAISPYTR